MDTIKEIEKVTENLENVAIYVLDTVAELRTSFAEAGMTYRQNDPQEVAQNARKGT